jgi:hypothetical protein
MTGQPSSAACDLISSSRFAGVMKTMTDGCELMVLLWPIEKLPRVVASLGGGISFTRDDGWSYCEGLARAEMLARNVLN